MTQVQEPLTLTLIVYGQELWERVVCPCYIGTYGGMELESVFLRFYLLMILMVYSWVRPVNFFGDEITSKFKPSDRGSNPGHSLAG
jgi:hypothetical protein